MDMLPTVVHERNYFSNLIIHILNIYFEKQLFYFSEEKKGARLERREPGMLS